MRNKKYYAMYMQNYYKTHPEQRERHRISGYQYRRNLGRFKLAKYKALQRNLIWNLNEQEFCSLILNTNCHYCKGLLPSTGCALDRKDNSKGYLLNNVVPCCHRCNTMKSSYLSYNEMVLIWSLRKGEKYAR